MSDLIVKTAGTACLLAATALVALAGLTRLTHLDLPASSPANLRPPTPQAPGPGQASVVLLADANGHFAAAPMVNGARIAMLVDTGASVVALSEEDASKAGIRPFPADFSVKIATANGVALGAPATLREIVVGDIAVRDVPALVLRRGTLQGSLLGMSFLARLSSFEVAGNRLVLRR